MRSLDESVEYLTTHNKLIIVFIFSKPRPFYTFDVI